MLSGLFTALFGLGYFWDIHVLWYFIVMQVHPHWRTWILPPRPHPAFLVAFGHRDAPISNRECRAFPLPSNLITHGVGAETTGCASPAEQGGLPVGQHQLLPMEPQEQCKQLWDCSSRNKTPKPSVFLTALGLGWLFLSPNWDPWIKSGIRQFCVMLPLFSQVCNGLVQTTGWPSVVACVGNWFGKGK